jgi:hypothetical protein
VIIRAHGVTSRGRGVAKVVVVKKTRRRRRNTRLKGPWMSVLALMAAESRSDGGAGLHLLLQRAKFDVRPHMSLAKRLADDLDLVA